uniref:Peptidase C1A papain C-terminal domain-containing protein n=1 Tax=Panagrolaimus superbus TaxID=310955 RepID=A0A914YWT0_9BILA
MPLKKKIFCHFGVILPKDLKPTVKRNAFDSDWSNDIPESFDFRVHGKVTPIKNQGPCGSCWAFTTAAAIESQYLLRFNQSLDLSEQSLVSCNSGAWGCNGGNVVQTLTYVQKNGIASETCMPYTVADGTCSTKCDTQKYYIGGYNHFGYDESKFASFLYNYGPAVVTMYVPPEFMLYDSGILDISKDECVEKNEGLHAMTIVGYTPEYWIIKNSWDTDWGEDGYVRVKRGINFCYLTLEVAAPYLNVTTVLPSTPATLKPTTPTPATPKPPTTPVVTPPPQPPTTPPTTKIPTRPPIPATTSAPTRPTSTPTRAIPTRPPTTPPPWTFPTTPTTPRQPIPVTHSNNNQGQQQQQFQGCSSGDGIRTMNDVTRGHVLNSINGKRSEIAHGQLQLSNGKRLPPGHNIRKLNYNCTIEYYAQHYASTCQQPNVPGTHMVLLAFPYDISISKYLLTFIKIGKKKCFVY